MFDIPKTLFLTWCTPDSRYAGGEAIRRLLSKLPADRIKWCGLNGSLSGPDPRLPECRAFVPGLGSLDGRLGHKQRIRLEPLS